MTVIPGGFTSGIFRLWFSTEAAAFNAARDARTRGFVVEIARVADRWTTDARVRSSIVPQAEFDRYASRLRRIATAHEGTYAGYAAD